jgi:hypothetical protein
MAKKQDQKDEVIVDIEEVYSKSEQLIEKYKKPITYVIGSIVVIIASYFGYVKLYLEPLEQEAQSEMFKAERYFEMDSLQKAVNGDGVSYGFVDIIDIYGGTKSANLAHYYLGISYLRLGMPHWVDWQPTRPSPCSQASGYRIYLLTSILVPPPGPPAPGPPGPSGTAAAPASATTSLTHRDSSSRKYDVSLAPFSASRLLCSVPSAAVVNSGSSKITKEPKSICPKERDSDSLAVSTLTSALLPIVVPPTYSERLPLRWRMIGLVMGPVWNPLKLPAMFKRPMSPVQTAAFQLGFISQVFSSDAMPLSRTMVAPGTPLTEPSRSWNAALR